MEKSMVIVNPASANGRTGRNWPRIAEQLRNAGIEFDAQITSKSKEATQLTRTALKRGYRVIIAVGGDGTLNEVLNGFFELENGCPINPEARLGLISSGTGRDFIKTINYPKDIKRACRTLARNHTRTIDIGQVCYQDSSGNKAASYYINVAGMGMDGETADRVNRTTKAFGGKISFLWGTIATLVQYRNRELTLEIDGVTRYHGEATLVAVANGRYFGGGMHIAPEARLNSGHFDIIIVDGMTKPEIIANLHRIYTGTHLSYPKVYLMRGKHVRATSHQKVLLNVDGEQPGMLDAEFKLLPQKLHLIC
ncbi:MAG: diacylglycerol/lipid kinase family protein [Bacillota bacterium]